MQIPDGTYALVREELRRYVYKPEDLETLLEANETVKTEKKLVLPAGLTVQFKGITTSQKGFVSVFQILRSQLGAEKVKAFSREFEGWVFLASDETVEDFLNLL